MMDPLKKSIVMGVLASRALGLSGEQLTQIERVLDGTAAHRVERERAYCTFDEVRRTFGIGQGCVRKWIRRGALVAVTLPGAVRPIGVTRESVDKLTCLRAEA